MTMYKKYSIAQIERYTNDRYSYLSSNRIWQAKIPFKQPKSCENQILTEDLSPSENPVKTYP